MGWYWSNIGSQEGKMYEPRRSVNVKPASSRRYKCEGRGGGDGDGEELQMK
jgi:hypothetical protein